MGGIVLKNSSGTGTGEKMVIMKASTGGKLRLFPGSNQVVLTSIYSDEYDVYKSTDSGDSWDIQPNFPAFLSASSNQTNAAVSFNNRYYYVGDPSSIGGTYYIAQSSDFGSTWTYDASSSGNVRFSNITASRDGKYVLGTSGGWQQNGDVWLSQDFGQTWSREFTGAQYFSCFVDPEGQNMIAGGYSTQTKYSDDYGDTWGNFSESLTFFKGAMVSGDGNYKVVWEQYESGSGSGSRAYVSTDWTNWTQHNLTVRLSAGAISNNGKYMLITSSDAYNSPEPYINLSTDYGANWSQINITGQVWPGNIYFNGCAMSSDGKYMVVIGGIRSGSTNYCYKSIDYGSTWEQITDIPGGRYQQVEMSKNGRYVYISGTSEGIFSSTDYMASWTQQFDGSTGTGTFINF